MISDLYKNMAPHTNLKCAMAGKCCVVKALARWFHLPCNNPENNFAPQK